TRFGNRELGEIESCLDQYPGLHSRIVVAREDTPGDKRLVAYVVMQPGETLDREDLQAFMLDRLPKFMVPAAVVVLDALPKNANGKIDRKALPVPGRQLATQKIVLPRSELEAQLVKIWQEVLGLEAVGITDNFFELGGNSLLVMRLFSELEASFNFALPPTDIFTAPTIEQLAVRLAAVMAGEGSDAMTVVAKQLKQSGSTISPLRIASDLVKSDLVKSDLIKTEPTGTDLARTDSVEIADSKSPILFLVHDADGDTGLYLHLVRQIKTDCSLYAIKPRTVAGAPLAYSRI
ncbi:MAG: phosphopantetheine-binding protein, partial [Cyanobacteria bacterium J06576_12]